ncbi:MAG: hypothetical protein KJO45_06010 [Sulfurovum sp.]|nr:hypothetical protein [Sulfurovum sp.]
MTLTAEEQRLSLLERITQPKVTFQSDFLSEANFKGYEGSVKTYKQRIQINNDIFGISYSRWDFDWSGESDLPFYKGKTPIDSMNRIRLYANWPLRINDKWFMLNSVNVNSTYEKEMSDSYGAGLASFFSYKLDDDHAIQMGAFANYHPVKTLALPVLGYSYRARETDGLKMVLGFPRAYVGYHLTPKILVNAGMVYSQAVIRLADDSGIETKGFSEAKDYQANVGFRYEITKDFELNLDLLYAFKRDFTIYDQNSNEVDSYSIEPSAGGLLKLKYIF